MLNAKVDAAPQNAIEILLSFMKAISFFVATVQRGVAPVVKAAAEILLGLRP